MVTLLAWLSTIRVTGIVHGHRESTGCVPIFIRASRSRYADNGDFWRVIYSNGMYPFAAGSRSDYFAYLHPQYHIMQYFNEHAVVVHSSQTLFVKLAQLLNGLLYSHKIFDIRFMGIVNFASTSVRCTC